MSENIKVVVRIRPELGSENSCKFKQVVQAVGTKTVLFDPPDESNKSIFTSQRNKDLRFAFDNVFGPECTQLDVYQQTTAHILDDVINGYNCCVFAYGATGAGKTFTMLGDKENPGVIFRTVMMLFRKIQALADEFTCELSVSYIEIYNEILKDLLCPGGKIIVNEDSSGVVNLRGATQHKPENADELMEMLHKGNSERTQTSTLANAQSSRSHAIFQIYLLKKPKVSGTSQRVTSSKFSLIDLAGSEKGCVSTSTKQQREGANINRSLLALGNVINALAEQKKTPGIYVPYRGSKLTRLLKDSLGGSCKTIMIANLSPSNKSYEDTYNTLKYADRAKKIKVELVKNVVEVQRHISDYESIIASLQAEIKTLKEVKPSEKAENEKESARKQAFEQAYQTFDKKCKEVFMERAQLKRDITRLEADEHLLSNQHNQCQEYLNLGVSEKRGTLLVTMSDISQKQTNVAQSIIKKKSNLDENCEKANEIQKEIHSHIQDNKGTVTKSEQELLIFLWEYHLTKVQSYYYEHSVRALQDAVISSQKQLSFVNSALKELFTTITTEDDKNTVTTLKRKADEVFQKLVEPPRKRNGVVWADDKENIFYPTSNLFPSPKLAVADSPGLTFTPGKALVGSTPQLNKLQQAYIRGKEFATPAPSDLQTCFRNKIFSDLKLNLNERLNSLDEEENDCLNSTFTLESGSTKLAETAPVKSMVGSKRKSMLPLPSKYGIARKIPRPTIKRNALVSPFPKATSESSKLSMSYQPKKLSKLTVPKRPLPNVRNHKNT